MMKNLKVIVKLKKFFRALTKDDIFEPYISDDDFGSSNNGVVELRYILYVFDVRYHQNFTATQPIKMDFEFDGFVPNDVSSYSLVLTNKLVSISSDGQGHFDLI